MSNLSNIGVEILFNGRKSQKTSHEGKTYIEAKEGSNYVIEVKNNGHSRVLCLVSADGLNVVSGKTSSSQDSGYIIDANSSILIDGWRISNGEVAQFKFGKKTYAASKGDGSEKNCGIISVKIFNEFVEPVINVNKWMFNKKPQDNYLPPWNPHYPYTPESPFGNGFTTWCNSNVIKSTSVKVSSILRSCNLSAEVVPAFSLGTEFGEKKSSAVVNVKFERGEELGTVNIYYASRGDLEKMNVPFKKQSKVAFPEGFPGDYCEPPKNWNK